jgi:hypothetical protein
VDAGGRFVTGRGRAVSAWGLLAAVMTVSPVVLYFSLSDPGGLKDMHTPDDVQWLASYVAMAVVGAVVASRRRVIVGWLFLATGVAGVSNMGAQLYAVRSTLVDPHTLPLPDVAAWVTGWSWPLSLSAAILGILFFPTGRLPSRMWRVVPLVLLASTAAIVLACMVGLWPLRRRLVIELQNPHALDGTAVQHVMMVAYPVMMGCVFAAMVSLVVRFRRSNGVERQQLKWIALVAAVAAPALVVQTVSPWAPSGSWAYYLTGALSSPTWFAAAAAFAIMRYRLYDIDRILSRTVAYLLVTGGLVAVYLGCVALTTAVVGSRSQAGVAVSTLVAAAVFQPLRRRVQSAVDHRFNRTRYDAVRTAERFSASLRAQVDLDQVSTGLLAVVGHSFQPSAVSLWLRGAP